jgi:hypothetical protein
MTPTGARLHHAILCDIVDRGRAPTVNELARRFASSDEAIRKALRRLADDHGVVLHPHDDEVWVAHPFSLAPTGFLVRRDEREWWGNCAWCSLGIAALVGGPVTITTTLGANDSQVNIRVDDGEVDTPDLLVHFPIPMTRVWNNVIYACSMMLVFDSEAKIDSWCARHGIAKGDVRPIGTVARFAADWYGRHLDPDWHKWTVSEARALIDRHGLSGPIWALPSEDGRF